jgi:hypothetical protein
VKKSHTIQKTVFPILYGRYYLRVLILLGIFYAQNLFPIGLPLNSCPEIISLAEIYILSNNSSSAFHQPAIIALDYSISHSNPFGFNELNLINVSSQFNLFDNILSLGAFIIDNNDISDRVFYMGYTRKIRELQFGGNLRHYYQKIGRYDALDVITFNVGAIWQNMMFTHGLSYSNISHSTTKGMEIPSLVKYELMISPLEKTNFALSLEKERHFDERYGFAVAQIITDYFIINTGFLNNPNQISAGVIIKLNQFEFGYGIRTHTELDMTHAVGMKWHFFD